MLEIIRCIAKEKRKDSLGKGTPRVGKCVLFLVFRGNLDLITPTKPVKELKEFLSKEGVKDLVDER